MRRGAAPAHRRRAAAAAANCSRLIVGELSSVDFAPQLLAQPSAESPEPRRGELTRGPKPVRGRVRRGRVGRVRGRCEVVGESGAPVRSSSSSGAGGCGSSGGGAEAWLVVREEGSRGHGSARELPVVALESRHVELLRNIRWSEPEKKPPAERISLRGRTHHHRYRPATTAPAGTQQRPADRDCYKEEKCAERGRRASIAQGARLGLAGGGQAPPLPRSTRRALERPQLP